MQSIIKEFGEIKVIGIEDKVPFDNHTIIGQVVDQFHQRCYEVSNRTNVTIGLCTPGNAGKSFNYLKGTIVSEIISVPDGMKSYTIPPKRYAIFTYKGHPSGIGEAWTYIHSEHGLKALNVEAEDKMMPFEYYDERAKGDQYEMDIYIPLKY